MLKAIQQRKTKKKFKHSLLFRFHFIKAVTCDIDDTLPAQLTATTMECEAGMTITFGVHNCTYTCAEGYNISADTAITCGSNSMLSSSLPNCTGINFILFLYCGRAKTKPFFFKKSHEYCTCMYKMNHWSPRAC